MFTNLFGVDSDDFCLDKYALAFRELVKFFITAF